MIASNDSFERSSRDQLPNSAKVYINGEIYKDIRVPMREIYLNPTKTINGDIEENKPILTELGYEIKKKELSRISE